MKKLLVILVLGFMLSSCGTPSHYHNISTSGHKASVIYPDEGQYGLSYNQPTIEFAVFAAFRNCESVAKLSSCELDYIDERQITNKGEKDDWRKRYLLNKDNYEFITDSQGNILIKKKD